MQAVETNVRFVDVIAVAEGGAEYSWLPVLWEMRWRCQPVECCR